MQNVAAAAEPGSSRRGGGMQAEPEGKCWSGKFEEIVGSVAQSCSAPLAQVIAMATGRGWLWSACTEEGAGARY